MGLTKQDREWFFDLVCWAVDVLAFLIRRRMPMSASARFAAALEDNDFLKDAMTAFREQKL